MRRQRARFPGQFLERAFDRRRRRATCRRQEPEIRSRGSRPRASRRAATIASRQSAGLADGGRAGRISYARDPPRHHPRDRRARIRADGAGLGWQHGTVCRIVRHRVGDLSRAHRHRHERQRHAGRGGRTGGRGADHDRGGPRGRHSRGAGLQRLHARQSRGTGGTRWFRPRPARLPDDRRQARQRRLHAGGTEGGAAAAPNRKSA